MTLRKDRVAALILAAGLGTRMRSNTTKQRMLIGGVSVLKRCVCAFEACPDICEIVVVARETELDFVRNELKGIKKLSNVVVGGKCRAESAICGMRAVSENSDFIAIHDAARPLIKPENISKVIKTAKEKGAATLASRVVDTVKIIDSDGRIISTPNRSTLVKATTPQIFKKEIYEHSVQNYNGELSAITDDNMLVEIAGYSVYSVISDDPNPKITVLEDLFVAEEILKGEKNV